MRFGHKSARFAREALATPIRISTKVKQFTFFVSAKFSLCFNFAETMRFELMKVLLPCLVSSEVPSTSSATSPFEHILNRHTLYTLLYFCRPDSHPPLASFRHLRSQASRANSSYTLYLKSSHSITIRAIFKNLSCYTCVSNYGIH